MKRKKFPFRLGTTSYIIPDDIIPNVRMLAPIVDDIELVLFESIEISNIPSEKVVCELKELSYKNSCSYTVHLPTDFKAGAETPEARKHFYRDVKQVIERCLPLDPHAFILHLEGLQKEADEKETAQWLERCGDTVEKLLDTVNDNSSVLAVENLAYPWYLHKELVEKTGMSICCDMGHLWLYCPEKWKQHLLDMLPLTTVIHLHGVWDKWDHASLAKGDRSLIHELFTVLSNHDYRGVVTLEVFNENDFRQSLKIVEDIWEKLH